MRLAVSLVAWFLGAKHVLRVFREYGEFYNRARPSQALHAVPDPYPELQRPSPTNGKLVAFSSEFDD